MNQFGLLFVLLFIIFSRNIGQKQKECIFNYLSFIWNIDKYRINEAFKMPHQMFQGKGGNPLYMYTYNGLQNIFGLSQGRNERARLEIPRTSNTFYISRQFNIWWYLMTPMQ